MDDENRLFISELTSNRCRVGSLRCIYNLAFPTPRFSSSSSRLRLQRPRPRWSEISK